MLKITEIIVPKIKIFGQDGWTKFAKQKNDARVLGILVSLAAVFWMSRNAPPKKHDKKRLTKNVTSKKRLRGRLNCSLISFLIIILINWCSLATWESSLSHNLILCYRLKRNCCFKNCSLLVAILTIRVYGKVDLVTITFLPIDLYIHICIVCFNEYLLSSI